MPTVTRWTITGFNARRKWDATTGLGSPKANQVVNFLTLFNSDSDAQQAMNNSGPERQPPLRPSPGT